MTGSNTAHLGDNLRLGLVVELALMPVAELFGHPSVGTIPAAGKQH